MGQILWDGNGDEIIGTGWDWLENPQGWDWDGENHGDGVGMGMGKFILPCHSLSPNYALSAASSADRR